LPKKYYFHIKTIYEANVLNKKNNRKFELEIFLFAFVDCKNNEFMNDVVVVVVVFCCC